ncbi:TPA: hypothetical protein RQN22_001814 [Aeromonas dhakensis]|nr:hypothetical protein [Aeromonas dhakensis]
MNESINKVRTVNKDDELIKMQEDNTAALELTAEASEQLKNSVDKNIATTDRNSERMQRLEQRLAEMGMPVHRYSEDKPEQVQSVIPPVSLPVVQHEAKPEKPKFERKNDTQSGFFNTLTNAGKTFAGSVMQAGADFGKSMTDQIGNELIPFYSDMKAAASKVAGGAIEAGKIVKSKFERKPEEKKEKKQAILPQVVVDKTEKVERVTELREKVKERKREHAEHKLYKKVDDIHDLLRNMLIINMIKSLIPDFGSFGSAIGKFAGMFARGGLVVAFFTALKTWGSKFVGESLKKIGAAFTSITSGIKDTFTKTVDSVKDGWKKLTEPKKVDTATPKSKPNPSPDIKTETKTKPVMNDGKPVIGKDGKPVFEKVPVEGKPFEGKAATTLENQVMKTGAKDVAIEAGETAGSKFAKKAGARVVAGAAGGPVGEIIAALMLLKDAIELGFAMFGKSPEMVGDYVKENTSMPEVDKAQTAATGGKLSFTGASLAEDRAKFEQATEAQKQAIKETEKRRTEALAASVNRGGNTNTNNTVVNNNSTSVAPSSFMTDHQQSAMGQAFANAFKSGMM